jgi:hypothetical protein
MIEIIHELIFLQYCSFLHFSVMYKKKLKSIWYEKSELGRCGKSSCVECETHPAMVERENQLNQVRFGFVIRFSRFFHPTL